MQNADENLYFQTERGSQYFLQNNGKTRRFKTETGEEQEPQDVIVFVPDYKTLLESSSENSDLLHFIGGFIHSENDFEQMLLEWVQRRNRNRVRLSVVSEDGAELHSNEQKKDSKKLFLKIEPPDGGVVLFLPVEAEPKIGFSPFDKRWFNDGEKFLSEQHLGNRVVDIFSKRT